MSEYKQYPRPLRVWKNLCKSSSHQGYINLKVTQLIDYACKTTNQGETQSSRQAMTDVESRYTRHSGVTFKLIDTPGFDNLAMSDSEVLTKIANYCLNP